MKAVLWVWLAAFGFAVAVVEFLEIVVLWGQ